MTPAISTQGNIRGIQQTSPSFHSRHCYIQLTVASSVTFVESMNDLHTQLVLITQGTYGL